MKKKSIIILNAMLIAIITSVPTLASDNDDTTAEVAFTAGELEILSVPDLFFGIHPISTNQLTLPARALSTGEIETPWGVNFAEVRDLTGSAAGWNLTVEVTEPFATTTGEQHVINGAELVFSGSNHSTTTPEGNAVDPTVQERFTLATTGGGHRIMSAPVESGIGYHRINWGQLADLNAAHTNGGASFPIIGENVAASPINLIIPGNAARSATYEAELTWTLVSGPGNLGLVTP